MKYLFGFFFAVNLSASHAISSTGSPPAEIPETTQDTDSKTKTDNLYAECTVDKADDANLIDDVHIYLNESFCNPAIWFDSFFSNERIDEELRPGSSLRWQNDYIEDEFGVSQYTTKLRGSFKLPKASKKLRLVFEGDPEDSVSDIVHSNTEDTESNIGLLYEFTRSPRASLSSKLSLSPSLTIRYRYSLPVSDHFTSRFTQQLFYKDSAFGASATVDFIYSFSEDLILRQANNLGRTEDDEASKWFSRLTLFQRLNEKSALSYEASYDGTTKPETFATNARIAVRYRRQIYRKWLFFEVAPQVTWPRELITDKGKKTWALFVRLEANFVNLK